MGTWNSRGLRGSTLEDMINRTNERYLEKGLALIQKIPTPITRCGLTRNTGILRLRILSSGVQWIISEQFRGSRFVLMQGV